MEKETQIIAARFAHELAGPLGAIGHSLEMAEHKISEILGDEAKFFKAGLDARLSPRPVVNLKLPKLPEALARRFERACEKNPEMLKLIENCDTAAIERAVKIFELGFNQKCASLGLESSQQIIKNLRNLGDFAKENFEETALQETLQIAWILVAERARHMTTRWEVPPTLRLKMNAHALTQVWMNLMLNAAQVNSKGCELAVSADKKESSVEIIFANTGKPLPKGLRLFAEGQSRRKGGRGIGLHVCKKIVEAHGGKISARSAPNQNGAIFKIVLPIK